MRVTMTCAERTWRFGSNDTDEHSGAVVINPTASVAIVAMVGAPPEWFAELLIGYTEGEVMKLIIEGQTVLSATAPEGVSSIDYFTAFSSNLATHGDPMAALITATLGPRAMGSGGVPIAEADARALQPSFQHAGVNQASGYARVEATGLFVFHQGRLLVGEKEDSRALVPGRLYVPGGKLEAGETINACALRELREETGIDALTADCVSVFQHVDVPRRRLYTFYQMVVESVSDHLTKSDDLHSLRWLDLATLSRANLFHLTRSQLLLFLMTPHWRRRLALVRRAH
jgi:8-oxo-dGTP diphosphatase